MSIDYKALLMRIVDEAWNKGEFDVIDEFTAESFVYHDLVMPDLHGPEGYKQYIQNVRSSYPDFHMTVDEIIFENDMLAGRLHWGGTQLGASPGLKVPPTGKHVNVVAAFICHVHDGKFTEQWTYQDWVGIMRQLGLLPQPAVT